MYHRLQPKKTNNFSTGQPQELATVMTYCENPTRNCESFKYNFSKHVVVTVKDLLGHAAPIQR